MEIPYPGPFGFLHLAGDPAFEAWVTQFEAEVRADERRICEAEDITRFEPIQKMLRRNRNIKPWAEVQAERAAFRQQRYDEADAASGVGQHNLRESA